MANPFHFHPLLSPLPERAAPLDPPSEEERGGNNTDVERGGDVEGGGKRQKLLASSFDPLPELPPPLKPLDRASSSEITDIEEQLQEEADQYSEVKQKEADASKDFYKKTGSIIKATTFPSLVDLVTAARMGVGISKGESARLLKACLAFLRIYRGGRLFSKVFRSTHVGDLIGTEVFGPEALANFPLFQKLNDQVADMARQATQKSWSAMTDQQKLLLAVKLLPVAQSDPHDLKFLNAQDRALEKKRHGIVEAVRFLRLWWYLWARIKAIVTPPHSFQSMYNLFCHAIPVVTEKGTKVTVTTREKGTLRLSYNTWNCNYIHTLPDGSIVSLSPPPSGWEGVKTAAEMLLGYDPDTTEDPPISSLRPPLVTKVIFAHIVTFLIPV